MCGGRWRMVEVGKVERSRVKVWGMGGVRSDGMVCYEEYEMS